MESYGVLSIIPPLTVILLALWTKKTLFSLIVGTYIGSVIINGGNILSIRNHASPWVLSCVLYRRNSV